MSAKHTGVEYTCVRLIPSISDDKVSCIATDRDGSVSIFEQPNQHKKTKSTPGTQPTRSSRLQRKCRVGVGTGAQNGFGDHKNILNGISIIDREHYLVTSSSANGSHVFIINNEFNSNTSVNVLKTSEIPNKTKPSDITSVSNTTSRHDQVFISSGSEIYSMALKSGAVQHYHSHGAPITKILAFGGDDIGGQRTLAGEFEQCFMTSDTRGHLSLFDSRMKQIVFHYKCGVAPSLLSIAKTTNMYGSSSIIATGAENGQISFYDLRNRKANQRSLYDKKSPMPVYDLVFSKTDPTYLYACGLQNITAIQSTTGPSISTRGDFIMEPWSETASAAGSQNSSFSPGASAINIDSSTGLTGVDGQRRVIATKREVLYKSDQSCFVSLDINENGDFVAVSDDGMIYYDRRFD